LAERTFALQEQAIYPLPGHLRREWESINALRVTGMLAAEACCRKLRLGNLAWSPALQLSINTITVWQLVIRRLRSLKVWTRFLNRATGKAKLPSAIHADFATATSSLSQAYKQYKSLKKEAEHHRQTWLEGLASALAQQGNTSAASHLQQLRTQEQQRRDARQIWRATGKLRPGGLLHVVAPNEHGDWVELTSRTEIEQACLQENERHFRQANTLYDPSIERRNWTHGHRPFRGFHIARHLQYPPGYR